ncbi:dihydroneopterin triphosphate diphosphatase [Hylemonella sp. W303a]|uniref:dihydroneopterin triphosphate diphosphatase n=1 Tax=Hylemonella sp. W303a TaxID=3389873 RepID=UPI00396B30A3
MDPAYGRSFKIPQSVLVVIHTPALEVLLIQRADTPDAWPEYWQSVTGSKDHVDEPYAVTAWREVQEETGIDAYQWPQGLRDWELENVYEIYPWWRKRYAPDVTHNTERLFSLCVPAGTPVRLSPREHRAYQWLPWREAAQVCASPSNAEACLLLPRFAQSVGGLGQKS